MAREAGMRVPVALTAAAWALCVELAPAVIATGDRSDLSRLAQGILNVTIFTL